MKIGILLSRFPYPLEKGDKLRAFHQIKHLSKNNEIYLCTLNANQKVTQKDLEKLKPYCKEIKVINISFLSILVNLIKSLFVDHLPLQVAYFFHRNKKNNVVSFFKDHKIEHLYCQLIRTTEYLRDVSFCPKTLDYMDALSQGMERRIDNAPFYLKPFIEIEARRLKKYEHFIFEDFDHKIIISEQDRDLIIHAKNNDIQVIRNGVDKDFFHPIKSKKKYDLVFTGNMSYPPNVDGVTYLVENILPIVWEVYPETTLVIAGANPSNKVNALKSDKVSVTGWVNDIREYYAKSRVFIAPMRIGTGLQNKLLEAMSMGIPCITTNLANNALSATNGKNILIGENENDLAKHIIDLLEDHDRAQQLATEAKNFVERNYTWESSVREIENLIK